MVSGSVCRAVWWCPGWLVSVRYPLARSAAIAHCMIALYAASNRFSGLSATSPASAGLRSAAASMRAIAARSGATRSSVRPTRFCKLMFRPHHEQLGALEHFADEGVRLRALLRPFLAAVDAGAHLAPQGLLRGMEQLHRLGKAQLAHDDEIDVAPRAPASARHGTVDDRAVDPSAHGLERPCEHLGEAGGLAQDAGELLVHRAGAVGAVELLIAASLPLEESGFGESRELPVQRPRRQTRA